MHETYLRLLQQRQMQAANRPDFLAVAGYAMRRVLVDEARRRKRQKRGGSDPAQPFDEEFAALLDEEDVDQVLAVDQMLGRLADLDTRATRIVECRVFAGMTLEETAEALGVSVKTVQRTWTLARAWLRKELGG